MRVFSKGDDNAGGFVSAYADAIDFVLAIRQVKNRRSLMFNEEMKMQLCAAPLHVLSMLCNVVSNPSERNMSHAIGYIAGQLDAGIIGPNGFWMGLVGQTLSNETARNQILPHIQACCDEATSRLTRKSTAVVKMWVQVIGKEESGAPVSKAHGSIPLYQKDGHWNLGDGSDGVSSAFLEALCQEEKSYDVGAFEKAMDDFDRGVIAACDKIQTGESVLIFVSTEAFGRFSFLLNSVECDRFGNIVEELELECL